MLDDRVVRVKVWTRDGRIVYSDEPRLIGSVYRLDEDELEALRTGETQAERATSTARRTASSARRARCTRCTRACARPNGTPLLFETYQRSERARLERPRDLAALRRRAARQPAPALAVQVPLAWRLVRRLERSAARSRGAAGEGASEASDDERRRIAADLHDGVVQDLAGLSYSLSAAADRAAARTSVRARRVAAAAGQRRREARFAQLRTLLVEIHPPNLRIAGLGAALDDLLAPLRGHGIATELDVPERARPPRRRPSCFSSAAAGEAIRNAQRHAGARRRARCASPRRTASCGSRCATTAPGSPRSSASGAARRATSASRSSRRLADRLGGSLDVSSRPRRRDDVRARGARRRDPARDRRRPRRRPRRAWRSSSRRSTRSSSSARRRTGRTPSTLCARPRPDVVLMDSRCRAWTGSRRHGGSRRSSPRSRSSCSRRSPTASGSCGRSTRGRPAICSRTRSPTSSRARSTRPRAATSPLDPKAARALLSARTTTSRATPSRSGSARCC